MDSGEGSYGISAVGLSVFSQKGTRIGSTAIHLSGPEATTRMYLRMYHHIGFKELL